jgi:hypothetical protein
MRLNALPKREQLPSVSFSDRFRCSPITYIFCPSLP